MPDAEHRTPLDLVFVVDPIETLVPGHDTSVALMEAAQARGHRLLVTTMPELSVRGGRAVARCRQVRVVPSVLRDGRWISAPQWFTPGSVRDVVLDDVHAVFVRTDPPVDAAYLRATYILDFVDASSTVMVNDPRGLRHANEKLFVLQFPDVTPETVVTADVRTIVDVTLEWGSAVLKPTEGMAGRGILLLRPDDPNLRSIAESATTRGRDQVVVQRFLPRSVEGDRRVIMLDGVPLGVVRRVAADGEFRCNMAAGARVEADTVTALDKQLCERIAGRMAEHGLVFAGIDVIGSSLTEINVTSPTGIREIDAHAGTRLGDEVVAWVERRSARLRGLVAPR